MSSSGSSSESDRSGPLSLGLTALQQGRYAEAIDALEMFCQLARSPQSQDYLHAQMSLAEAYYRIGQSERSIALCRKLIANPNPQVKAWASKVLESLAPELIEPIQATTAPSPSSHPSPQQPATLSIAETPPQSTSSPAERLLPLSAEAAAERFRQVQQALKQEDYDDAVQMLEDYCRRVNPQEKGYVQAQRALVKAYKVTGQTDEAIVVCQQLVENEQEIVRVWAKNMLQALRSQASLSSETTASPATIAIETSPPAVASAAETTSPADSLIGANTKDSATNTTAATVKLRSLEQLKTFYEAKLIDDLAAIEKFRQTVLIKIAIATSVFLILEGMAILFLPTLSNWLADSREAAIEFTVATGRAAYPTLAVITFFAYLLAMVVGVFVWIFFWVFTADRYRETCEINIAGKIIDFIDENGSLNYFHNPGDWEQMRFAVSDFRNSTIFNHLAAPNQIVQGNGVVSKLGNTHLLWSEILAIDDGLGSTPNASDYAPGGFRLKAIAALYRVTVDFAIKLIMGAIYILVNLLTGQRIYMQHFHQRMLTDQPAPKIIFKGLFFSVALDQNFAGRTVLFPSNEKVWIQLGESVNFLSRGSGKLIELRVPKFEQFFCVYSNNPTEARAIFSPKLMKVLFAFRQKTNRKIYLSCLENRLYIAIPFKWFFFEQKLLKNPLNFRPIQGYLESLQFMLDIVKLFKQNPKL